jgi:hypothetical protein
MTESPTAVTWPATRPPDGGGNGRVVVGATVIAGGAVLFGVDFVIAGLGVTAVVLGDKVVGVPVELGEVGGTVVVITDDGGVVVAPRTLP